MRNIIISILLIINLDLSFAQTRQKYFNQGDSSSTLSMLPWLNYKYIFGRYTNSYGAPQKIKLGSMFTIAGDSVIVSAGGTGDVNQNGNSFGTTMKVGTNDNNTFTLETNNTDRFSISSGSSTGGLITHNARTANTNSDFDAYTCNLTSTGTVASGFGGALKFTAPNGSGTIKDLSSIKSSWTTVLAGSEYAKMSFNVDAYGSLVECGYFWPGVVGGGSLRIDNFYPLDIDGTSFKPNLGYEFAGTQNMKVSSTKTSDSYAVHLHASGVGSGTGIQNATYNSTNAPSSTILTLSGSITNSSIGSGNYGGITISQTISQASNSFNTCWGVRILPTLTNTTEYRALDIQNTSGRGVYQSSGNVLNHFAGKSMFGSTGNPTVALQVNNGRFATAKGTDIASAGDITLSSNGNSYNVTGTTTINTISATDWPSGSIVYLIMKNSVTLVHNGTGAGAKMFLSGSINYAAVNNSVLGLLYDGAVWQEISRKTP